MGSTAKYAKAAQVSAVKTLLWLRVRFAARRSDVQSRR